MKMKYFTEETIKTSLFAYCGTLNKNSCKIADGQICGHLAPSMDAMESALNAAAKEITNKVLKSTHVPQFDVNQLSTIQDAVRYFSDNKDLNKDLNKDQEIEINKILERIKILFNVLYSTIAWSEMDERHNHLNSLLDDSK